MENDFLYVLFKMSTPPQIVLTGHDSVQFSDSTTSSASPTVSPTIETLERFCNFWENGGKKLKTICFSFQNISGIWYIVYAGVISSYESPSEIPQMKQREKQNESYALQRYHSSPIIINYNRSFKGVQRPSQTLSKKFIRALKSLPSNYGIYMKKFAKTTQRIMTVNKGMIRTIDRNRKTIHILRKRLIHTRSPVLYLVEFFRLFGDVNSVRRILDYLDILINNTDTNTEEYETYIHVRHHMNEVYENMIHPQRSEDSTNNADNEESTGSTESDDDTSDSDGEDDEEESEGDDTAPMAPMAPMTTMYHRPISLPTLPTLPTNGGNRRRFTGIRNIVQNLFNTMVSNPHNPHNPHNSHNPNNSEILNGVLESMNANDVNGILNTNFSNTDIRSILSSEQFRRIMGNLQSDGTAESLGNIIHGEAQRLGGNAIDSVSRIISTMIDQVRAAPAPTITRTATTTVQPTDYIYSRMRTPRQAHMINTSQRHTTTPNLRQPVPTAQTTQTTPPVAPSSIPQEHPGSIIQSILQTLSNSSTTSPGTPVSVNNTPPNPQTISNTESTISAAPPTTATTTTTATNAPNRTELSNVFQSMLNSLMNGNTQ